VSASSRRVEIAPRPKSFTLGGVEVEIRPEPDDDERAAIVLALARAGVAEPRPRGYESPWRAAALRESAETDDAEP
jgi:hypothetical protein